MYEKPEVRDYGTIAALTEATGYRGPEDGTVKDPLVPIPHHSGPLV